MQPVSMLLAGVIEGVYGIKGWVKVRALTDPVENFLAFDRWFTRHFKGQGQGQGQVKGQRQDGSEEYRPIKFTDGRIQGKGLIAKIDGVDDRTQAEALRGTEIWIHAEALPALGDGEYYWHDLQDVQVWCDHKGTAILLGEVDHLLSTGGNDVLVVRPCEDSIDDRERLIPYVPDAVVRTVDVEKGLMKVDWHPED